MSKKSFANRVSWKVIKVVSVLFVVSLVVVGVTSNNLISSEATRATQYMLHGTISDIELPLNEVEVVAQIVAVHVGDEATADELLALTGATVATDTLICGCSIIDAERGEACYSYEDSTGAVRSAQTSGGSDWVGRCIEASRRLKAPFWAEPYMADGDRQARVTSFCYPIFKVGEGGDSTLVRVVSAELPVDWMEHKCESLRPYKNSLTTITCGNSIIGISDTALIALIKKTMAENKDLQALGDDMKLGKDSIRRFMNGTKLSFAVYGPLHNGWAVSIVCQYKEVLARSSAMHVNLFAIGVIGLAALFFVCRRTIRKETSAITELSDAALNMAKGNFKSQLPEIKSQDELMNLRDSFVYMQNSIVDYIEELKTTTSANERMESELNVARNIQKGMLRNDFPPMLYAMLEPAKEVGGDLYDFAMMDGKLYFAIGDVSGKGVPAALMMAITRAALRFVAGLGLPMAQTLSRINNSVSDTNSNEMFVTLIVGRIDPKSGRMEYCNAGHNPLIIIPPDGEPYYLKAKPNLAIGLFEDFPYESESTVLKPGTRIVAYTDGVNEAERADKSLYGNGRLLEWAMSTTARSTTSSEKEVVESLYAEVRTFADGNPPNDDVTIMSIMV